MAQNTQLLPSEPANSSPYITTAPDEEMPTASSSSNQTFRIDIPSTNGHSNKRKTFNIIDKATSKCYDVGVEFWDFELRALKLEMADITKIPPSQQQWIEVLDQDDICSDGSTSASIRRTQGERDILCFYKSGITLPKNFTVKKSPNSSSLSTQELNKEQTFQLFCDVEHLAEQMKKEEKNRVETEERAIRKKRESHKRFLPAILPPEPQSIITVRFVCPALPESTSIESSSSSGTQSGNSSNIILCRKFSSNECLRNLMFYLAIQGYHSKDYKVVFGWPRKEVTLLSDKLCEKTLDELKFSTQETFIVKKR